MSLNHMERLMKAPSLEKILDDAETRFFALLPQKGFARAVFGLDHGVVRVDEISPAFYMLTAYTQDGVCLGCKTVLVSDQVERTNKIVRPKLQPR